MRTRPWPIQQVRDYIAGLIADHANITTAHGTRPSQWTIPVNVWMTALNNSGWANNSAVAAAIGGYYKINSAGLGSYIEWDINLDAGTWRAEVMHRQSTTHGQIGVKVDGVTVGTIEAYAAAEANNTRTIVSGVAVATSGVKRIRLEVTGKHASSTNYNAQINGLQLVRTA